MKTITVIGAGTMGHGIAQLAATAGYRVFLNDIKQEFIDKGLERIKWSISKFIEKDKISEEKSKEILGRLEPELDLTKAVEAADIVIEAVFEDLEIKQELMGKIDEHLKEGAIVATNTSTLPITEISEPLSLPENAIGMHFFNPPQLMPLIEIIRGEKTSDKTLEVIVNLSKEMGKDVVVCLKDVPGFIVNRILGPIFTEAAWMLEHGEADILAIDSAVKYRLSLPMGVFELADYTGIDVIYRAQKYFRERGLEGKQPSIWEQKFKANEHGVKAGKGFYTYKTGPLGREQPKIPRESGADVDLVRLFAAAINSGAEIVREEIATREDTDKSIELGLAFPKGILKMADEFGLDKVVEKLKELQGKYGDQYKPDPLLEQLIKDGKTGVKAGQGFYDYAEEKEEYKTIILRKEPESKIAWLTLNRPHRLNSFTLESIDDLRQAFLEIADDSDIRVLVITGAGEKAFCTGADITAFGGELTPSNGRDLSAKGHDLLAMIEKLPQPVIAAINGYAYAGGCELAIACDFRIAAKRAKIGLTEIRLSLIPGWGGTQRLPRIIGLARAKEAIMLARTYTAEEALDIGLIHKVIENESFEEEVKDFALNLAEQSPIAMKLVKQCINRGSQVPLDVGLELEAQAFGILFSTEDLYEGIAAFMAKRKPEYKGK
jgi:enoyl-CoA hydratase/3-hydroxyacyl-CoA dehydrogenase